MTVKSIAALAGLALVLTPFAISAIDAAAARQPNPVPVPTPVSALRADLEQGVRIAPARAVEIRTCGPAVRVVSTGYGEPVGPRCTVKRVDAQ